MAEWVRVASVDEIPEGTGKEVVVGDRIVAVYHTDGWYALDGICPHAGGPLGQGHVQGQTVTCPWHGWQFDVSTGQHRLNSSICQSTFPIRIEANDVLVEIP